MAHAATRRPPPCHGWGSVREPLTTRELDRLLKAIKTVYKDKEYEPVEKIMAVMDADRSGDIDTTTKVWRTAGGNVYKVEVGRRYNIDRVCSCDSWGHMCEILMIITVMACTMFSMSLLDWNDKREEGARRLLVVMALFTVVLVIATIKKVGGRWQKVSSDTFVSEV